MSRFRSLAAVAALASILASAPSFAADNYQVDASHSSILFRVMHKNVAPFYGRFNDFSGTIAVDEADFTKSSINLEVKAESVDTNNQGREKHLRSADFFNVQQFPTISFASTSIAKVEGKDNKFTVTGNLTMLGVTKSVTFEFTRTGSVEGERGKATGGEAFIIIKRSDFGMNFMVGPLGDEVTLIVGIEAVAPKS